MDLDEIMTVGRVVCVHADGSVSDAPDGVQAPQLEMGSLDDEAGSILATHEEDYIAQAARQGWTIMTAGYSSQDRYSGVVMHECESIGNCLERDILAVPGYYAALEVRMADGRDDHDSGWVVVRRTVPGALTAARIAVMGLPRRQMATQDELRQAITLAHACGIPQAELRAAILRGHGNGSLLLAFDDPDGMPRRIYAQEPPALRQHPLEPSLCYSSCPAQCLLRLAT